MGGQGSGRRKSPSSSKQLKGRERKDRRNDNEPIPPAGDVRCPDNLNDGARAVWERLAPSLIAKHVLTAWDVDAFAILCDAIDRGDQAREALDREGVVVERPVFNRNGELTGHRVVKNEWWGAWRDANEIAARYGARFGWTPADRAVLKVGGDGGQEEPGADLLSG